MELITIKARTTKESGSIKLRFRLRDGRDIEMYHKSGIEVKIPELAKLTNEGTKKKGVSVVSQKLLNDISDEKKTMKLAYEKMKADGMDMNSETFESVIAGIKTPVLEVRKDQPYVVERFRKYADDALRDRILGKKRHDHIIVVADKLDRFLTIKGLSELSAPEFTDALLMEFRNFIFDEYKYVDKYKRLYKDVNSFNKPKARLSLNTVASQMKMLQTFFTELENSDEIIKSPFRRLGKERKKAVMKTKYDDPVFLRSDEFKKILNTDVPSVLKDTKDAFLLQCAFGCRISDFSRFSMQTISVSPEGIPYIHYIPQKTADAQFDNRELETPIVRYAFDIIKATEFNLPVLKNLYGTMGFSQKIKDLLQFCKINREVPVYNEETKQNDYFPLYKVGSSKLARKTYVDMMNKVQINLYAAGLHKEGSAAVHRYTNMEIKDRFALMNAAFDQKPYKVDADLNIIEETE